MEQVLFTPGQIGGMRLKNRIIMSGMHMGFAQQRCVSRQDMGFYISRAKGGAAAIIVVASVNERGGPMDMHCLDKDDYIDGFQKLSALMHGEDCKCIVQLFHSGRNGTPVPLQGKLPLAPSAVPSPLYKTVPKVMTQQDIKDTITDFAAAAARCKRAGVDAVEISCSAGYLLSQFLSPLTNLRTDEWGGSAAARMRFPNEVMKAVRAAVGDDYPVLIKISAADMLPGGYGIDDMRDFIRQIPDGVVNAVTVTGGWHEAAVPQISYHLPEGGFAFLARQIKEVTTLPVVACNRVNNGEVAERVLQNSDADFVGCGRAFIADPMFAVKIQKGEPFNRCQGCNKGCIEQVLKLKPCACAYNARVGKELVSECAQVKKFALVVGGGPAGMEAARSAARCGHNVILCTEEESLGGKLHVAKIAPDKQDIIGFAETLSAELEALGVEIRLNTKVDSDLIRELHPSRVIFATGAAPLVPKISGLDSFGSVMTAEQALIADDAVLGKVLSGKTIIIGGGSVGLETALYLARKKGAVRGDRQFLDTFVDRELLPMLQSKPNITVIEMDKKFAQNMGSTKWILLREIKDMSIELMPQTKVKCAESGVVTVETPSGTKELPADIVILAVGYAARDISELIKTVKDEAIEYSIVGDAQKIGDVMSGTHAAYKAVMEM